MLRSTGARRYAQALLEVGRDHGFTEAQLDNWAASLRTMADVMASPDLARRLADPAIAEAQKRTVVRNSLEQAIPNVDPMLSKLADMLITRERTRYMGPIAEQFQAMLNRRRGVVNAEVVSAVPLTPDQTKRLGDELSRAMEREVALKTSVDPAILGGIVLRIGDRLVDASVAGRLSALRQQLV